MEVKDNVLSKMDELNDGLLKERGMRMDYDFDDVQYITESVVSVRKNLVIGALLATFVLFLFLRSPSATLIGAMGIPVCTLAAFLGLLISGRTINVISLAGVAFAIGMTLDNSIVVLENIYRHRSAGKDRAARRAGWCSRGVACAAGVHADNGVRVHPDRLHQAGGRSVVFGYCSCDFCIHSDVPAGRDPGGADTV